MAKLSGVNKMVKCGDCGALTHSAVGGSSTGLCPGCYDAAGLENAHADGAHADAPHASCPTCKAAPTSERRVAPSSIGARLDARGLTHRQVCRGGKHLVEVRMMGDLVHSGTTSEIAAWLDSYTAQRSFQDQFSGAVSASGAAARATHRVTRETPDGPCGWRDEQVAAWSREEAKTLALDARKLPRTKRVRVESL